MTIELFALMLRTASSGNFCKVWGVYEELEAAYSDAIVIAEKADRKLVVGEKSTIPYLRL
jgi:hypothetical protein